MNYVREYTWANKQNIGKIDLVNFTPEIGDAVVKALPSYYILYVGVKSDNFVIITDKPITNSHSPMLGKEIGKISAIGGLCTSYSYKNNGRSNPIFKGKDIT